MKTLSEVEKYIEEHKKQLAVKGIPKNEAQWYNLVEEMLSKNNNKDYPIPGHHS